MGIKIIGITSKDLERTNKSDNFAVQAVFKCPYCGDLFRTRIIEVKKGKTASCGCVRFTKLHPFLKKPYKGEIDSNPSNEKIQKAVKEFKHKSKYEVYLTDKEIANLIFNNCYWLGIKPSNLFFTGVLDDLPFYINGIDRLDSTKPYTKENSVTCSTEANYFKGPISAEQFLKYCNQVVKTNEHRIRNKKTSTTGTTVLVGHDKRAL
jgi:hypothetical protein